MNHTFSLSIVLLLFALSTRSMAAMPDGVQVWAYGRQSSITQSDSVKKHPVKPRASAVKPTKQAEPSHYSAPGHYTVTVPVINGPGGKADLILVNGTRQVERIGDVDANTIESIEVFKDTKTIAKYKVQYGDIANKGVVLIHLKNKTL